MKRILLTTIFAVSLTSTAFGQHADIEFGLDDIANPTTVEIESDQVNVDGVQILEGEFSDLNFGGGPDLFTDNPGFITPSDEGLIFNPGDSVSVQFLDASNTPGITIGAGYVNFFDPTDPSAGIQALGDITITNANNAESTALSGSGSPTNGGSLFLALGDDGNGQSTPPGGEAPEALEPGEIHTHLNFNLTGASNDLVGAIGLLAQFEVDLAAGGEVSSDPFFVVFNAGLDEETFENVAIPAFLGVAAVPEPSAGVLLLALSGMMITRRRRKS